MTTPDNTTDTTPDPITFNDRERHYAQMFQAAFTRGMWDGVRFGYVPNYDGEELLAWSAGLSFVNRGGSVSHGEEYIADLQEEGVQDFLSEQRYFKSVEPC